MKGKYFLDTNVLVYTFDVSHPAKQKRASELVADALLENKGIISYQVVQEFLNVATKKFATPMSPLDANLYFEQVLMPLCDFYPDSEFYQFALTLKHQIRFSFYDSLIVAAALKSHCKILYSEDMQDGQEIGDLVIRNPFDGVVRRRASTW